MLSGTSALGSTAWISIRKKKPQQDDVRFQSTIPELFHHYSKKLALEDDILKPNHFILIYKNKIKKSYVLPPHSEFTASPRRQGEGEIAFSFEKKCPSWKHLLVAGVIQCFPPSLCCSQPRQGEASLLCEQGFQNSPFIIKAAKLADANRLPPFILNCKINFGD